MKMNRELHILFSLTLIAHHTTAFGGRHKRNPVHTGLGRFGLYILRFLAIKGKICSPKLTSPKPNPNLKCSQCCDEKELRTCVDWKEPS